MRYNTLISSSILLVLFIFYQATCARHYLAGSVLFGDNVISEKLQIDLLEFFQLNIQDGLETDQFGKHRMKLSGITIFLYCFLFD